LKAVFLEVAFPDELADLAQRAGHHTPSTFAAELEKIAADVSVVAVHLKPRYRARLLAELGALARPNLSIGSPSREYAW